MSPTNTTETKKAPRKRKTAATSTEPENAAAPQAPADQELAITPSIEDGPPTPAPEAQADGFEAEEVQRAAYELYLARGGQDGNDVADWLEAERLVRQRRSSGNRLRTDQSRTDQSRPDDLHADPGAGA